MTTNKQSYIGVFDKNNVNKFYNIYTSDASISELKEFASLPANALIISSPISQGANSYDLGTPAIVMTDTYGTPVSLTYTFAYDMFNFDETTNTVSIASIDSLNNTIRDIEYKFKKLCSSKAILDNGDNTYTSTVSFIDNTTYLLKLEKWANQTLSAYQRNIGQIIIPGPHHLTNNSYVFAHYGNNGNTVECSICLGYFLDYAYFNSVDTTYSTINNNCIKYITSYSLMNNYYDNEYGKKFLKVVSSDTNGLVMNDIIGVGDSKKYIVTKPILGKRNKRIGSYTFLKFPTESLPDGEHRIIRLQVNEGNKCVASNICEISIEWKCDERDLPTAWPTPLPTIPSPTPSSTYS